HFQKMSTNDDWFQTAIDDYELKNIPFESFSRKKKKIGRDGFGDIYSVICESIPSIPEVIALKGVSVGDEDNEDNDQYYLVIEFADEGDLRGYLTKKKGNLKWEEKLNLAIQITEGITYIHNEHNIAHRDL
ncbi:4376_t:CDS:2, partial [Racocetra fulgida]